MILGRQPDDSINRLVNKRLGATEPGDSVMACVAEFHEFDALNA